MEGLQFWLSDDWYFTSVAAIYYFIYGLLYGNIPTFIEKGTVIKSIVQLYSLLLTENKFL